MIATTAKIKAETAAEEFDILFSPLTARPSLNLALTNSANRTVINSTIASDALALLPGAITFAR
jgi:hypothetical protein